MKIVKKMNIFPLSLKVTNFILVLAFLFIGSQNIMAQEGDGGNSEGVPLDAGVSFLVVAAAGYGMKKMNEKEEV